MESASKSSSPPTTAAKKKRNRRRSQLPSTNAGAVTSLAPPVTSAPLVALPKERKGISTVEKLSLPPELKAIAAKIEGVKFLKPGDFDKLVNNADDIDELRAWMTELNRLYLDCGTKHEATQFPRMGKLGEADNEAFENAKEALGTTAQQYLSRVPAVKSLSSGWGAVSVVTVHVAAAAAEEEEEVPVVESIPSNATVTASHTPHGNFVPLGGGAGGITKARLVQYYKDNRHLFELSKTQLGGTAYKTFSLFLGESAMDSTGNSPDWYITVRYYKNTNRVLIDHFGPFGARTGGGVS